MRNSHPIQQVEAFGEHSLEIFQGPFQSPGEAPFSTLPSTPLSTLPSTPPASS